MGEISSVVAVGDIFSSSLLVVGSINGGGGCAIIHVALITEKTTP